MRGQFEHSGYYTEVFPYNLPSFQKNGHYANKHAFSTYNLNIFKLLLWYGSWFERIRSISIEYFSHYSFIHTSFTTPPYKGGGGVALTEAAAKQQTSRIICWYDLIVPKAC